MTDTRPTIRPAASRRRVPAGMVPVAQALALRPACGAGPVTAPMPVQEAITAPLDRGPTRTQQRQERRQGRRWGRAVAGVTLVLAVGLLAGGGPVLLSHLDRKQITPRCVRWRSCACRFPGSGRWPGHNRICSITWGPDYRPYNRGPASRPAHDPSRR